MGSRPPRFSVVSPPPASSLNPRAAAPHPVLSYPAARVLTVGVSAWGFFLINLLAGWLIGSALSRDILSATHARYVFALGLASTSFFAAHNAAIGPLDSYAQGRMRLPPQATGAPAAARSRNPWRVGLLSLGVVGTTAAAISGWVVPQVWPHGVSVLRLALWFAGTSALLGGLIMLVQMGRPFLEQARVPLRERRFAGSYAAYLWQRHALPQGLVNAIINAWVGLAIAPVVHHEGVRSVPASFVQHDAIGTGVLLALLIAGGAYSHARFDRRWGVIDAQPHPVPAPALRAAIILGYSSGFAALGVCLELLGISSLELRVYIALRALGCGTLSALVAYRVARWTSASTEAARRTAS